MQHAIATVTARLVVNRKLIMKSFLLTLGVMVFSTGVLLAAGETSGVPWETALEGMLGIFTGQTARYIAGLMFIGGAFMWATSKAEDGFSTIGKIILAVGLIVGSLSITELIFGAVV